MKNENVYFISVYKKIDTHTQWQPAQKHCLNTSVKNML